MNAGILALLALGACADIPNPFAPTPAPSTAEDDKPAGRWVEQAHPPVSAEIAALEAIGYLAEGEADAAPAAEGVAVLSRGAWPGLNLVTSGHGPEAVLLDMEGNGLYHWSMSMEQAMPEVWDTKIKGTARERNAHHWRKVHALPDGDLIAIWGGLGAVRLDRDSQIVWAALDGAHHDLDVSPNGSTYLLTRTAHVLPRVDEEKAILEDFLTVLAPDGEVLTRISLLEAIEHSDYRPLWTATEEKTGDSFHTNTVFFLREQGVHPAFQPGRVLVSMRELDLVGVIDVGTKRFEWMMQGTFRAQHDPRITPAGTLLLFDNQGAGRRRSRVLEYDLSGATPELSWSYEGSELAPFYSKECGISQPLPNANVLVTETDNGRAFEITRDHRVVWAYNTPHRSGDAGQYVAKLFEVERLPLDYFPWLAVPEP